MINLKEIAKGIYILLQDCKNPRDDEFYKGEILIDVNGFQLARVNALPADPALMLVDCVVEST